MIREEIPHEAQIFVAEGVAKWKEYLEEFILSKFVKSNGKVELTVENAEDFKAFLN